MSKSNFGIGHANLHLTILSSTFKSIFNLIRWQYLKNDLAIEDYHKILTKLKRLYTGKWISTGISKGGVVSDIIDEVFKGSPYTVKHR